MKTSFLGVLLLAATTAALGQGKQLTGPHAPSSQAALSPEEAQKRFVVPEGFEVRLFAAEPDVVNPVGMTWDARGRLWVLELFEYPMGAPDGAKPRDQIKILEDTDADGRADVVKVFADGLNLATGILLGDGGVYVGQAPYLLFLEDTDGDDRADKQTILKEGFGLHDRHELLNGFTWGPDGWLYMTHGVFTHSKVKDPNDPDDNGLIMNAAVARYHPRTKEFEIFADGTSNPWGVDFDRSGNAFVSACVIDHIFHMAPGGLYARQGGQPEYRYAYELLPSIADHKHYRVAYCGIQIYQGHQYPAEYSGRVMMGNIHANAVVQDSLTAKGASFVASEEEDFVDANDGWFRPISQQVGPDGALWIGDWYDKYPCYQNARADPEGVDRAYGRIWRVVHTGNTPGAAVATRTSPDFNLDKRSTDKLVATLSHPNVWHREMAQKILSDRQDSAAKQPLVDLLKNGKNLESRLAALWTLYSASLIDEAILNEFQSDTDPAIRAWVARITGERQRYTETTILRLSELATDPDPTVRVAVATATRQLVSDKLTINRLPQGQSSVPEIGQIIAPLIAASTADEDPLIDFIIWMAAEPRIAEEPEWALDWLVENGASHMPLAGQLAYKTMRRICDSGDKWHMQSAVDFIHQIGSHPSFATSTINGLLDGQKGNVLKPNSIPSRFFTKLISSQNQDLSNAALQLGALWGDTSSVAKLTQSIEDSSKSVEQRRQAIALCKRIPTNAARQAVAQAVGNQDTPELAIAAIDTLRVIGDDQTPSILLGQWSSLPASAQRLVAETMTARREWTNAFLDAIEAGTIASGNVPTTVIRSLAYHRDSRIKERSTKVIGRFREPDANLERLIYEKKQVVVNGPIDLEAGAKIAEQTCLVCHKLHGKGADVGPDLTGVGRSSLDALLANIINPNQIIGNGYENYVIETKDDRILSGRLIEDTDSFVKIAGAGGRIDTIGTNEIASRTKTEMSVMPEGLEQLPEDAFRNMIWYLLNPPEDNRPMTDELRASLIGSSEAAPPRDYESISLWDPAWEVNSREQGIAPAKLGEYHGKKNVLVTHPFWHQRAATLERQFTVPEGKQTSLDLEVSSADNGKWVLRVFVEAKLIKKQIIDAANHDWTEVSVDLTPFAGQEVDLKLENYAYNLENDFAYWHSVKINSI